MQDNHRNENAANTCRIRVGTSGYSYTEWAEAGFYPSDIRAGDMLPFYAGIFPITELNYTWYQLPKAPGIERMCCQVAADFRFTAKLTRTLTHEVDPGLWRQHVLRYRDGISPLVQTGQLMAVLLQLPPSFDRTRNNRHYLAMLLDELAGLPLAVEFRHRTWAKDRVFDELERRRITLAAVDEPNLPELFPQLDIVTNPDLFYVRFHGRNTGGWRSGHIQKQFDYDYADDELHEWIEKKIEKMTTAARNGIIFFNNHVRAQAPENAKRFIDQLVQKGFLSNGF